MVKSKFTLSVAMKLQRLLEGGTLPASAMPRWMASELQSEGLIAVQTHGSRNSYQVLDKNSCASYVVRKYTGGADLSRWIALNRMPKEDLDRSVLVKETARSKSISLRTFRGFLVNCCEPIPASMGDRHFVLSPAIDTAIFIQNPDMFTIPSDVVVVGIENGDNFRYIRRQRYLFKAEKVLFVSRYPQSADLREWLLHVPNRYVHFGDFDLAGIQIYQSEFYKYLGSRATFFIPSDIEERLKKGNAELYDRQYERYHLMKIEDVRVQSLVSLIHRYRKGYEQEGYLE